MSEIIAIGLDRMHQDMRRLEYVAMNLTNVVTPGYKRQVAVAHPFSDVVDRLQSAGIDTKQDGMPDATPAASVEAFADFRAGTLRSTGQSLDLALEGEGFFEIATDSGPAYTRQGNFRLDERGRLVNEQGYPVMGNGGEVILSSASPGIDGNGHVFASKDLGDPGTALAQIKVLKFEDTHSMKALGNGLFSAGSGMTQLTGTEVRMRQGFLENSNVSTQQEMIELMQTMRHFESMQKIVQGNDELIGTAIRKLGDM